MNTSSVKSLLLVEDDPDDQELFEMALQEVDATIQLEKAYDGIHALEKLSSSRPDLIVLDINMPRMNGRDFLRAVKENTLLSSIPVVLYSTTSHSKYTEEIVALGARSFFKKPDSFETLCLELKNNLY